MAQLSSWSQRHTNTEGSQDQHRWEETTAPPSQTNRAFTSNTQDSFPAKDSRNTPWNSRFLFGKYKNKISRHSHSSKRSRGILWQIALICAIFFVNFLLALYAGAKFPIRDGVGLIYAGDCTKVKNINRFLHLLINILSTGMLSTSNFCIQLQTSPTRADIDRAHERNSWLDIGVPSLRNLRYIGRWRLISCAILALSSLPIHLIFNSAIFQALGSNDYTIAVVKNSFLTGAGWNLTTAELNRGADAGWNNSAVNPLWDYQSIISGIQNDTAHSLYEYKNASDCFAFYEDYWSVQGNGVVLVNNETIQDNEDSLLLYVGIVPRYDNYAKNNWASNNGSGERIAFYSPPDSSGPVTTWYVGPPHYEVSHCLVQTPEATDIRCRIEYSTHILYAVLILNFFKILIILVIWFTRNREEKRHKARGEEWGDLSARETPMSTLGDAIALFMRDPDPTTKGMCLATKHDFGRCILPRKESPRQDSSIKPREYKPQRRRWMSAVTRKQWSSLVLSYTAFIVAFYVSVSFLTTSLRQRGFDLTFTFIRTLGFGSVNELTYLVRNLPRGDPWGLIVNVLVVNSPQLLFSMIYTLCGAVLTTFLVQREFSLMYRSDRRKTLRVSEPVGIQRSSYFISLPLRYGIPLKVFGAVFHWLISQSFFLSRVTALFPNGTEDYDDSFSTLGYSPYGVIVTGIVGFVYLTIIIILGFRKYDSTMPLVATNSRAISAACQGTEQDRKFGYQMPVQWGVIGFGEDGVAHCAFSAAPSHMIGVPEYGRVYH
ncbi:hypothetical protein F5Y16DRAFT_421676 [Xylariaceae sp. FL0255]|nr:hypothetical protein F5Y16DRAFT_421676 [Xylariaceae sp. FL0255]